MRGPSALLVAILIAGPGCDKGDFQGPEAEVRMHESKIELPAVGRFDIPVPSNPHTVRELRLLGESLLDQEVEVQGILNWIYDCAIAGGPGGAIGGEGATEKQRRKLIASGDARCWRPHFTLGESTETAGHESLWVVEVPRELRRDEKRRLHRSQLANLPSVPAIKVGDEVVVTGIWALKSPNDFRRSQGLLVFKALRHVGTREETPSGEEEPARDQETAGDDEEPQGL